MNLPVKTALDYKIAFIESVLPAQLHALRNDLPYSKWSPPYEMSNSSPFMRRVSENVVHNTELMV